jgi:GH24 family phage-related lysozyme (muramidase)
MKTRKLNALLFAAAMAVAVVALGFASFARRCDYPEAYALIVASEGFVGVAKPDCAGVVTYGYGETVDERGRRLEAGATITRREASERLVRRLDQYARDIQGVCRTPLSPCQLQALMSFEHNFGLSKMKSSTMMRKLNAGDARGAMDELEKWHHATVGGVQKDLEGLKARRSAERRLFESGQGG